jgi:hypothetical protein
MLHEQLVRQIQRFGAEARESRQVYRRLTHLLPDRLRAIANGFRGTGQGPTECARLACVSEEFMSHIEEIVEIGASSWEARIQYETHMMLIDARRTLRTLRASKP